ncbi:MAG: hypothetical protein AAGA48_32630 [Myxococcota bacterium]
MLHWWSSVWTLMACAPPDAEDVPVEIEEATEFLFAHIDDEAPDTLQLVIEQTILPYVQAKLDAVVDPSDPFDPGYFTDLSPLTEANLGSLSLPEGTLAEDQRVPVARAYRSRHATASFRQLAAVADRTCIEPETTHWAQREYTTDPDCYANGECTWIAAIQPTLKVNPLAAIWYDQHLEQRKLSIEVEDEPWDVIVSRSFLTESWASKNGNNHWDQLWTLDVVVDQPDGAVTWSAYWSAMRVQWLTDGILATSVRAGMVEASAWADHFIAQGTPHPDCPHVRGAPMPERWPNGSE